MKKNLLLLLIIVLAPKLSLQAAEIEYSFYGSLSQLSGQTEYELNVRGIDTIQSSIQVVRKLRSLLEFPLNSTIGTFGISISSAGDSTKRWIVSLDITRNFNDPTEVMKDSDWDELEGFFPMTKFSYTESIPEMNFLEFHFKSQYQISGNMKNYNFILFGIKKQKIEQSIDNFTGWRRLFDENSISYLPRDTIPQFSNLPALYYRVTYKTPYVGFGIRRSFGNSSSIDLSASYALVMASDFDNHLLRKKTAESNGNGNGIFLNGSGSFLIDKFGSSNKLYFEANIGYSKFQINTTQTQSWYGDDPASSFDDTGAVQSGIPYSIRSSQLAIGFKLRLSL